MQRRICSRKMDELGRIILPKEVRSALKVKEQQVFDILIDGETILLQKITTCPDMICTEE